MQDPDSTFYLCPQLNFCLLFFPFPEQPHNVLHKPMHMVSSLLNTQRWFLYFDRKSCPPHCRTCSFPTSICQRKLPEKFWFLLTQASLTHPSPVCPRVPNSNPACQISFLHQAKHPHDSYWRKRWRGSLLWILFQSSGTKLNTPHSWT